LASEHGQIHLRASEYRTGGGERVELDEKMLRQGMDVTEAPLERMNGV
jgi:hypothetical protein